MPAKRKSSKASARKKTVAKKTARRSKTTGTVRKKARAGKKTRARVPARKKKKATAKKKVAKKKAALTKTTKKKTTKKKAVKKTAAGRTKKSPARKAVSAKATASRKAARRAPRRRHRADMLAGPLRGVEPYKAAKGEPYMSDGQLGHFRDILQTWKRELMEEVDRTVHHMKDEAANFPDPNDRATQESEFGLELRTRDRERKLLRKIDSALLRIGDGSYGYCVETGEAIGLKRLEARPVATLTLEAQERRELAERQYRDRDDRYR